jgi:hypothetical protein
MTVLTVVFANLSGETRCLAEYSASEATQAITGWQWIGRGALHPRQNGVVVKESGGGVLMVFKNNADAVEA